MVKFLLILFATTLSLQAQNKLICDSLLRKDPDFWYSNADAIFQGKLTDIKDRKNFSRYTISPNRAFAGAAEQLILRQNKTAQWFNFEYDTDYVIFVFEKYQDPIFSPCVLFGKASKMQAVIEKYETYCGSDPIKESCLCNPYYDPVCGCDGYNYKNPCEAACDGVYDFFRGPCLNSTPMRVKEE